jgi:hypothetical protein
MKVALVLGLAAAVLVAVAIGTVQRRTREIGPVVAQVARDLSTDEGARGFLKQHPETLEEDDTEAVFLQRLGSWRARFGAPPQGASVSKERLRAMPRPFGWRAYLKGEGEAWLGVLAVGKALHVFPAINASERGRLTLHMEKAWKRALAEMALEAGRSLQDDASARQLYRENPALAERFPSEAAFLEEATRLRTSLKGLQLKAVVLAPNEVSTEVRGTPFGYRVVLRVRLEGGQRLRVVWNRDRLGDIGLE